MQMGQEEEALEPLEESVRIKQHNLGANHPDLAPDLLKLAELLMSLVRFWGAEAEFLFFTCSSAPAQV